MSRPSILLAAMTLGLSTAGQAAAIVLWPVDPTIAAAQQSTAVWIENRGAEPVTMQIRSLGWNQSQGSDDYAAQDSVVSSPPVAQVAPGGRQLIRIIRRAPDTGSEHAYRLLIDELPRPVGTADGPATASLAVQMRYSIPLFTYGAGEQTAASLTARIVLAGTQRFVEIHNAGGRHARLTDLRVVTGAQSSTVVAGLAGYVLAGATRRFPLPSTAPPAGQIIAGVNGSQQTLASAI